MPRHAAIHVDLDAVAHNVRVLREVAGAAELCAVVKADAYGHGAAEVATTVIDAGAGCLAVALVEEAAALRDAGIEAPILLLSEPPLDALRDAWKLQVTPTVYHRDAIETATKVVPGGTRWGVQLKVDTGMHRVGTTPDDAVDLAVAVMTNRELILEGVFTHLAVADEPDRPETAEQLDRFDQVVATMRERGIDTGIVHAANSAGCLAHPAARLDRVRCGIALYGLAPSPGLEGVVDLRPAMSVTAEVSHTLEARAGDGVSYGLRHRVDRDTTLAVVPVGYADGVSRILGERDASVLIGGVRRPIRGVVTMDQIVVEVGDGPPVGRGDEVVLLGRQEGPAGADEITAGEWAERLGTIVYEVVCGFGPRLPRRHHGGPSEEPGRG